MDMEARSQPAERARQLAPKVKEYRADLAALRDQHQQQAVAGAGPSSSAAADAARAELGLGGGEDYTSSAAGQRDRMLAATDRLQKTSDRLQQGKQQLAETEVRERKERARERARILISACRFPVESVLVPHAARAPSASLSLPRPNQPHETTPASLFSPLITKRPRAPTCWRSCSGSASRCSARGRHSTARRASCATASRRSRAWGACGRSGSLVF